MWEQIPEPEEVTSTEGTIMSHRLEVPGGWIVRTVTSRYDAGTSSSQIFIADHDHSWKLS